MLDTERQPEPGQTDDQAFSTLLTEVDEIQVEPETPAEEAVASADKPEDAPPEAPATEGTATPAGDDAAAEPEGDEPTAEAPAADSGETPTDQTPVEIDLDGRKLTIAEARIDKGRGDKVVLPRTALETVLKTQVAEAVGRERTNFGRERAQLRTRLQQMEQAKSASEHTAGQILGELDKIMGKVASDPATAFDEFEKLANGYHDRKEKARADYWEAQAKGKTQSGDQERYQREMSEYVPVLQQHLRRFTEEAVGTVKDKLAGLSEQEVTEFTEQLYQELLDDADAGRIYTHTGEQIEGTLLPKLDVNFQRIATVVERAVGRTRKTLDLVATERAELKKLREQVAKIEAAAKQNAEAAQRRKGTPAPPAVSGKPGSEGPSRTKDAASFDDILAEVDKL